MENTFYPINDYRSYLAHHGVKGMKWGVRHDKYSKYRNNRDKYSRTNKILDNMEKAGKGTPEYAKNKRKLKNAIRYDKGRELYSQGKTIEGINRKSGMRTAAASLAMLGTYYGLPSKYVNLKVNGKPIGMMPMNELATATVFAGWLALEATMGTKEEIDKRNLRAYYVGGPKT